MLNQIGQLFAPMLQASGIEWHALNDNAARRRLVLQILQQIPVLWIWDNVEPIAGFPTGSESLWTPQEQSDLADFLKQIKLDRATQAKILLTSRRDEGKWLGRVPQRIKMPRMRATDASRLAIEIGAERKLDRSQIGHWQPLLDYCAGNPLTLRIIAGQAVRMGLQNRDQIAAFIQAVRDGEQQIEDEDAAEGRDRSLGASLDYGFRNAFQPDELPIIALLHLFQGTVDVQALVWMGEGEHALPELKGKTPDHLSNLLDRARAIEDAADARLQALQAQIDEAVYDLYEISPADRALIERELGDRPPELVWPQMGGKSDEEKRREHVRRFFSYYARQAVREDEDGIVPLAGCAAREPYLVDRVRAQLEAQFGPTVAYQLEQDGAAYLGRPVEEWLRRYFFARFHVKLYKKRPILWHLTSPRRHFAVLVDYHRLTRDTLPKVQTLYLWPHKEEVRTRLAAARVNQGAVKIIADLEDELADLEEMEKQLAQVIDSGYNPDIDDGVKVNLLPLQEAGLLPVKKVV